MSTTNTTLWARFEIVCEWKGREARFFVDARDANEATEMGRSRCKKEVGMPPSSVIQRVYVGDVPAPSGRMDPGILARQGAEIMYNRRP